MVNPKDIVWKTVKVIDATLEPTTEKPASVEQGELLNAKCSKCGKGVLVRVLKTSVSARITERLDNGAMPKALERLANAEEVYRDHAKSKDR